MTICSLHIHAAWHSQTDSFDIAVHVKRQDFFESPARVDTFLERHLEILHGGGEPVLVLKGVANEAMQAWLKSIHQTLPF